MCYNVRAGKIRRKKKGMTIVKKNEKTGSGSSETASSIVMGVLLAFTVTIGLYFFLVINVTSHPLFVPICLFSLIDLIALFAVFGFGDQLVKKIGGACTGALCLQTLVYTVLQFAMVVYCRSEATREEYTKAAIGLLIVYVVIGGLTFVAYRYADYPEKCPRFLSALFKDN